MSERQGPAASVDQVAVARALIQEMRFDSVDVDEFGPMDLLDYMAIVGVSFSRSCEAVDTYHAELDRARP